MTDLALPETPIHNTHDLPITPPTKIFGRNKALGQIFTQLRAGASALVSGPEGTGKSALAATLAAAYTTFPAGVLWWSTTHDDLAQLAVRVGRAYNLPHITEAEDPVDALINTNTPLNADDRPLIVLDGLQDLNAGRDFARKIAPGVPLIITSTQNAPGPWMPFTLGPIGDDDAIDMLQHTAHLGRSTTIIQADMQAVINALDNQPLALNLVGKHLAATRQTPGEFLGALTSQSISNTRLPGMHTIFHQLPNHLQNSLLTIGATSAGHASTMLLKYLLLMEPETVIKNMDTLAAMGLVQRHGSQPENPCYTMHPLLKEFVQTWLHDTQRSDTMEDRVQQGIVAYAEQAKQDTPAARLSLVTEMPNFMALAHQTDHADHRLIVQRIASSIEMAFSSSGLYDYEIAYLYSLGQKLDDLPDPVHPVDEPLPTSPPLDDALVIDGANHDQPSIDQDEPDISEIPPTPTQQSFSHAIADLLKASQVAREAGNRTELAGALHLLGKAWMEKQQFPTAEASFNEAMGIFEEANDLDALLQVLDDLAELSLKTENLENTIVYASRAESLARQMGDLLRQGQLLAQLGDARLALGQSDDAIATYINAIETLTATDDVISLGVVQTKLGSAYLDQEDYTRAITMLTEARDIFLKAKRIDYLGRAVASLAAAYGHLGDWENATANHQAALEIATQLEQSHEQERQYVNLAHAALATGLRDDAVGYYRAALHTVYQSNNEAAQVIYLRHLGRLLMDDMSQLGLAFKCLEAANAIESDVEYERLLNRTLRRMAHSQTMIDENIDVAAWAASYIERND